jgi:uncharacterized protein YigE (DUF2233 family)
MLRDVLAGRHSVESSWYTEIVRGFWLLLLSVGAILLGLACSGVVTGLRPAVTQALGQLQGAARQSPALDARGGASRQSSWQEISPGVQMRRWHVTIEGLRVPVVAVRADASRLRIGTGATLDVAAWRRRLASAAVVNGGFFDTDGRTLGLRISRGKQISPLRSADWGVFYVSSRGARIVHTRDWAGWSKRVKARVREAVQCGPRLVVAGRVLQLKPQWARRTGLGIMRDGRIVLAVTEDEMSFAGWAALWARRDGFNCVDALNLDGGGSTQIAIRTAKSTYDVSGAWPVPDVVAVN